MPSGIGCVVGETDSALCTAPSREVLDSTLLFRVALSPALLVLYRTERSQHLSPFRNRRVLESTSFGGDTLSSALGRLKTVRVCVQIGALACLVQAQTYKVGDSSAQKPESPQSNNTDQTSSPNKSLGWGSNIQNARLGRAAEQALKNLNYTAAV